MYSPIVSTFVVLFVSSLSQAGKIPPSSSAVKNLNQQFLDYESNINRQNPNKQNVQPSIGGLNSKTVSLPAHSPSQPISTPAKPTVTHGASNQNVKVNGGQTDGKPVLGVNSAPLPDAHRPSQNSHVHVDQNAGKPGNVPQSNPTNHGGTNQNSHTHVGQHAGKPGNVPQPLPTNQGATIQNSHIQVGKPISGGNPQSPPPTHGVTSQDLNKHLSHATSTNNANKNNPYDTNFPALPTGQNVKQLVQLYNSRDEESKRAQMNTRPYKYSDVVSGTHKGQSA